MSDTTGELLQAPPTEADPKKDFLEREIPVESPLAKRVAKLKFEHEGKGRRTAERIEHLFPFLKQEIDNEKKAMGALPNKNDRQRGLESAQRMEDELLQGNPIALEFLSRALTNDLIDDRKYLGDFKILRKPGKNAKDTIKEINQDISIAQVLAYEMKMQNESNAAKQNKPYNTDQMQSAVAMGDWRLPFADLSKRSDQAQVKPDNIIDIRDHMKSPTSPAASQVLVAAKV